MKRVFFSLLLVVVSAFAALGQGLSALEQLSSDPRKAYGTDYPYSFEAQKLTPAPKGYKPFYVSHYARHGSRYYWNDKLYKELDELLTAAHEKNLLTPQGEAFYVKFEAAKDELMTGISELTQLGWEQHQKIARVMYDSFRDVFKKGGNVVAVSSLSGRCVISMSAFCQELVQCNPEIEIREISSRFTLDGVVPTDGQNPVKHDYPKAKPRYEANMAGFPWNTTWRDELLSRIFVSTEGLPGSRHHITGNLVNLYTSLPNIYHEGMMDGIMTDEEIASRWEETNLGSYSWVFSDQYRMIPILQDIISKADAVLDGSSDHIADLRFGHDSCIGPLTVLMGINGADLDPEDPFSVKDCYQNWETCKACNIQLVFYRSRKAPADILVKCLLNGAEAKLPVPTECYPYYRWSDFRSFYLDRCASVK